MTINTRNLKIKLLAGLVAIVLFAIIYGSYMFNKKVPELDTVSPDFVITADDLYATFEMDENSATEKYTDKVIEVTGEIEQVTHSENGTNIILKAKNAMMGGVNCSTRHQNRNLQAGQTISIKGRCQGFLMAVIINNAKVVV